MDEWTVREVIARAIRGWIIAEGYDTLDDADVMTLATHVSETLYQDTELPITRELEIEHTGSMSDFGQPPIMP